MRNLTVQLSDSFFFSFSTGPMIVPFPARTSPLRLSNLYSWVVGSEQ